MGFEPLCLLNDFYGAVIIVTINFTIANKQTLVKMEYSQIHLIENRWVLI